MRTTNLGALVALFVLLAGAPLARGGTILPLPHLDPQTTLFGSLSYTKGAGTTGFLEATGSSGSYKRTGETWTSLTAATFRLSADVNSTTGSLSNVQLLVKGDVDPGRSGSETLFNATTLLAFNYKSKPGAVLQFLFAKGSGEFETLSTNPFTGVELYCLVKPPPEINGAIDYSSSFTSTTVKADAFATPLPAAGIGGVVLLGALGAGRAASRGLKRRPA